MGWIQLPHNAVFGKNKKIHKQSSTEISLLYFTALLLILESFPVNLARWNLSPMGRCKNFAVAPWD